MANTTYPTPLHKQISGQVGKAFEAVEKLIAKSSDFCFWDFEKEQKGLFKFVKPIKMTNIAEGPRGEWFIDYFLLIKSKYPGSYNNLAKAYKHMGLVKLSRPYTSWKPKPKKGTLEEALIEQSFYKDGAGFRIFFLKTHRNPNEGFLIRIKLNKALVKKNLGQDTLKKVKDSLGQIGQSALREHRSLLSQSTLKAYF